MNKKIKHIWIHESHLQGMILVLQFSVYEYLYRVHLYAWTSMCAHVLVEAAVGLPVSSTIAFHFVWWASPNLELSS